LLAIVVVAFCATVVVALLEELDVLFGCIDVVYAVVFWVVKLLTTGMLGWLLLLKRLLMLKV
jgi:hypothetical protein